MRIFASQLSPDGKLTLACTEHFGTLSVGFLECGWHIHPDELVRWYSEDSVSEAEAFLRFWVDVLSDKLAICVEPPGSGPGSYAYVCEPRDLTDRVGEDEGWTFRYWSGRPVWGRSCSCAASTAQDLMCQAPSTVAQEQLEELFLESKPPKPEPDAGSSAET